MADGQSQGGKKRAKVLTKEQRSEIARAGAIAKWKKQGVAAKATPTAVYGSADKPLRIADIEIPVYVLDDGRRVIVQRGLKGAIGMSMSGGTSGAQRVARFMESLAAKGVEIKDLATRITTPIVFKIPGIPNPAYGYEATILPDVCDVIWEAYQRGLLQKQQAHIGVQAQALTRALAKTGIIALVDEITGYQEFRQKNALAEILDAFIAKELRPWVRRFPFEFYREIFRLKGWDTTDLTPNGPKPIEVGKITADVIYRRMGPIEIFKSLKRLTPRNPKGYLSNKLHLWLSAEVGDPKLAAHIDKVITVMKLSDDWSDFMRNLERAGIRRYSDNLEFEFDEAPRRALPAPTSVASNEER